MIYSGNIFAKVSFRIIAVFKVREKFLCIYLRKNISEIILKNVVELTVLDRYKSEFILVRYL